MATYKNDRKLGSGGFGQVWRTIREEDGEVFAKKVLVDTSTEAVKRFQREVRILNRLDHPRIMKIVATRLQKPPYWYAMPLYRRSLRNEFPGITGDEARIVKIFSAILEGMQYAHEQGVIHRDLKPENILLNNDDDVVISDFGLGRAIDAKTTRATFTGQSAGTPGYMAPEQFMDAKRADHRSDIFSLGRILYELCTGESVTGLQDLKVVPVGIAMIVERCAKADPSQRFDNVKEMRNAFDSMVAAKSEATAGEKIMALLARAIADGNLSTSKAREFADLIGTARNDTDLLHDVCMGLPLLAFKTLWRVNPLVAKMLIKVFTDQVASQSWPFSYTDKIGQACDRLHDATLDHEIRGMLIAAIVEVGVSHNRWSVMDVAAGLLSQKKEPKEGLAVAHALANCRVSLDALTDKLTLAKLDPSIRELFAKSRRTM